MQKAIPTALLFLLAPAGPGSAAVTGDRLEPFPLRDVRILEGPFLSAQRRDVDYLLSLDPDRLLHTFRRNAGLPSAVKPYGGWEAPEVELRGHSLGHYLTACALMYEATGDERLETRALGIVAELQIVQKALTARGMHEGYLSAFPEDFFDRLEARQRVWAPYYTLHKIMAGLLDVHRVTGDATALEVLRGIASWVALRAARLSDAQWQALLETEFGGMEDVLTGLYALTHDPEHLRLARLFDQRALFDPLSRGEDPLDGLHANTQIPKAIGAALDCQLTGEARYCAVAETFWQRVALHRSYAIGGNSEDEHFSPLRAFSRHLGEATAETCNTYNMLKLTRRLFLREPRAELMDFYERALFNHILASQDPASGMMTYYVPLEAGAFRTYSTREDSFWCCVGTGMENPARYGEAVYARGEAALYVNLYLASELRWPERGLVLRQETRFPDEDRSRFTLRLERPQRFALLLRHPAWATGGLRLSVNGAQAVVDDRPGSYARVEREWHDRDRLEVALPMGLRFEPMPDDPTVAALLFGPVVLAADLGHAGLNDARRYGPSAPELRLDELQGLPALVAASPVAALASIEPGQGPLEFHTKGLGRPRDLELRPFFRLSDRRYSVYFDLLSEAEWAERARRAAAAQAEKAAIDARTLDLVHGGVAEEESAHGLQDAGSDSGWLEGRRYRAARWRGSFTYALRAGAHPPAQLRVTYWGGESRRHRFEVLVDGEVIATQTLFDDLPGEPFAVDYPLPERMRRGQEPLRVTFRPLSAGSVGAVFEVRLLRAAAPPEQAQP